jgi:DNA-3-methyladenine glycosylase I
MDGPRAHLVEGPDGLLRCWWAQGPLLEALLELPGMIRDRAEARAVIANARILVGLHAEGSGLGAITEDVLRDVPPRADRAPLTRADVPASSASSVALARRLRGVGWRFVGPTTAHASLQASGWVDDHVLGCHARGTHGPGRHLG